MAETCRYTRSTLSKSGALETSKQALANEHFLRQFDKNLEMLNVLLCDEVTVFKLLIKEHLKHGDPNLNSAFEYFKSLDHSFFTQRLVFTIQQMHIRNLPKNHPFFLTSENEKNRSDIHCYLQKTKNLRIAAEIVYTVAAMSPLALFGSLYLAPQYPLIGIAIFAVMAITLLTSFALSYAADYFQAKSQTAIESSIAAGLPSPTPT